MARTPSATDEQENTVETVENTGDAATPVEPAKPKTTQVVPITVPIDFYNTLKAKAEEVGGEGASVAGLARKMLADAFGYTLPAFSRARRAKYASEDERKAAQKDRYAKMKALLEAFEAGDIDPSIVEKHKAPAST